MWQELTSASPQKYNNAEIERIKASNEALHAENEKLRLEMMSLTEGRKALLEKIQEQERAKQAVQKELTRAQNNMKFEIKAREGLSKKTSMYEFEALNLRDECKNQREELGILRFRASDLEYKLNQERSKRLRDMHESDILRKRNAELESSEKYAEKDALKARQDLNDKLERMEVVLAQNESQKRVIESMSGEVLALNAEITSLKQDLRRLTESKYKLDSTVAMHTREKEGLEREIWRLRKENVHRGGTWRDTATGTATGTGTGTMGVEGRLLDGGVSEASPHFSSDWKDSSDMSATLPSTRGGGEMSFGTSANAHTFRQRTGSADVVSMGSTPYRNGHSQSMMEGKGEVWCLVARGSVVDCESMGGGRCVYLCDILCLVGIITYRGIVITDILFLHAY